MPQLPQNAPRPAKRQRMGEELSEFKQGKLKNAANGKVVTNPKQALAIGLSVSGQSKTGASKRNFIKR